MVYPCGLCNCLYKSHSVSLWRHCSTNKEAPPNQASSLVRRGDLFIGAAASPNLRFYFAVMVQSPSELTWTKPGVSCTVPL